MRKAVAVVGEDAFDRDALGGEPGDRAAEERNAVVAVLGPSELRIGESRVRVDRSMDVV
jgi:hypothetical protein